MLRPVGKHAVLSSVGILLRGWGALLLWCPWLPLTPTTGWNSLTGCPFCLPQAPVMAYRPAQAPFHSIFTLQQRRGVGPHHITSQGPIVASKHAGKGLLSGRKPTVLLIAPPGSYCCDQARCDCSD